MSSPQSISTINDLSSFQLSLIMKSAIPRIDVLHKMMSYITYVGLDGKAFMKLTDKQLANIACYDSFSIARIRDLRNAQPHDIQSLLEERWRRRPEPTATTQEGTPELHDEVPTDPVSNPLPAPTNLDSLTLPPDTATIIEAAPIFTDVDTNTQSSTDESDQNRSSSLDLESSTPTLSNLEPAIAAEASPIDPHSVPLPQLGDSELDLNVEEDDIYEDSSSSIAVRSELEFDSDGLSSDDTSDDESQAWSLVGDEETEEVHVSAENEVEVNEELRCEGVSSSPIDITHDTLPLVTPEDVDASAAAQSLLPDGGIDQDQIISAVVNSTTPEAFEPLGSQGPEAGPSPPLAEDDDRPLSPTVDGPATSVNVSESETSSDVQVAKESTTLIGSVDTDRSSPDSSPETSQTAHVVPTSEPSVPPIESATPEDDQANTASATDETSIAVLFNTEEDTPEVIHHSDTVSTEESTGAVVDDLLEEQPVLIPVTNETPTIHLEESHSERPHTEQPLPPPSNPSEVSGELPTDDSDNSVQPVAEDLDPITFEDSASAPEISSQSDDIPVTHVVHSPVEISVELDVSASASPTSSTRSVFSDAPFSNRPFPEFQLLSPVNPLLHLDKRSVLFFCEGACDDYNFMTSPIDVTQLPLSSWFEQVDPPIEDGALAAGNELQLVDHPLPIDDHTVLDGSFSLDDFFYDPLSLDESSLNGEPAFSSSDNLIDLLDDVPTEGRSEALFMTEAVYASVESSLLDADTRVEASDPVITLSGTSTTNDEEQFIVVSNNNQEETSTLSIKTVQRASDEAASATLENDSVVPLPAASQITNETVQEASNVTPNEPLIERGDVTILGPVEESISAPLQPSLLDENVAEASGPASEMHDSDSVVTLPDDGGQLTGISDNNQETSMLSNETAQQVLGEATLAMSDGDPAVPLPTASGLNEGQPAEEIPTQSSEVVQRASNVVNPDESLNEVERSISVPFVPPLLDEDRTEAPTMPGNYPVVPLPATPSTNEGQLADDSQLETPMLSNQTVQQASNEVPDEPLIETAHAVEPSRFKGLPLINTNITSLIDDLSAYLSPEDYQNPIVHTSYPTPFSSLPRLRLPPGSPTRSLFPRCESSNFTSDRTVAKYSKRLHEALGRSPGRSIAIQTDFGSQDLKSGTREENSTTSSVVASALATPISVVSSFRQFFSFGGDRPRSEED